MVGHGAAGEASTRAARHHRHTQAVAGGQHGLHVRLSLRQHHHQGALAVGGQAIAFVGRGVLRGVEHSVGWHHLLQRLNHLLLKDGPGRFG